MVATIVRRRRTTQCAPRVQVFRTPDSWRLRVRHFPPVPYILGDGRTGTLRRTIWISAGPYEIRVVL